MGLEREFKIVERQHWLLRAKLETPRQQISLVHRPRLLARLDETLDRRLSLVVAPAGFGKTTLLAQWREHLLARGVKVAWLTLDEGDGEARQFLSYVIFALAAGGVEMGRLLALAEQGLTEHPVQSALAAILEAVAADKARVALALDDYHRIQHAEIDSLLNRMVETSPPNFTLVINSRLRPALNLPQLLAAGQATETDAETLRFSREETRAALNPEMSDDQLQILFQRTEGWAMAVQLARLVGTSDRGGGQTISSFRGHNAHLAAYLADQVLAKLPDDLQDFLIRTSIFERFNAPLANAVTERNDGFEILRRLEPLHALLVPLDERHDWFRYHHLFADYLQDMLRRKHPDLVDDLHLRASQWFEDNGFVAEAVRHARLGGNFARCAALIEAAGAWELILFGGIGYLRNLLRNVPDRELARFPRLQVAKAYLALKDGQILEARRGLNEAAANPLGLVAQEDRSRGLGRDLLNVGILQDVYEDRPISREQLDIWQGFADAMPESDGITRGVLSCAESLGALALGDLRGAEDICRRAVRAMRQANSLLGINYCYLHSGLASFYLGKLRLAEASFWEAQRLAEDNFGADSGLRSLADILLGGLVFWRDGWKEGDAKRFRSAVEHAEHYDGWFEIYALALDVEVAAHRDAGQLQAAEAAVERAERIVEIRGIGRLAHLASAHRLSILVEQGESAAARVIGEGLEASLPIGCWRNDSFLWRPYQEVALALAQWHGSRDRARSLRILDDLVACCRALALDLYLVKALIARALLLDQTGARADALTALSEALLLAAPERMKTPFRTARALQPLLYAAQKKARDEAADTLTVSFIASCLEMGRHATEATTKGAGGLFSAREYEVLLELVQGHSNKEIARALDLTEHTVKFHLKNVFAKLKVERRAEAIAELRRRNIISNP